jgi:hypothetical protein
VEFSRNRTRKDGRQNRCKVCDGWRARDRYRRSPADRLRTMRRKAAAVNANRERLLAHLLAHPCVDCGETDPVVLDFDHVTGTKFMGIGVMLAGGYCWASIRREIGKCQVRCANCHRRRHAKESAWFKGNS